MARHRVSTDLSGLSMAAALAVVLAAVLAAVSGCTTHIADSLPTAVGGLPEHTPARPTTQAEFPAVHDRPEARTEGLLSEDERKKLKDELSASRDRTTKLAPKSEPPAKEQLAKKKLAAPAASKKKTEPAATGSVSAAGATPNP
jgi:hypothetical protein